MDHDIESVLVFLFIVGIGIIYAFCRYANSKLAKEKKALKDPVSTKEIDAPLVAYRLHIRDTSFGEIKVEALNFNRYYLLKLKEEFKYQTDAGSKFRILYVTSTKFILDDKEYDIKKDPDLTILARKYMMLELII